MSSIPLPALAVQPPQQQDPLGQYAKVVQLKSLLQNQAQQQQMQPLQLQEAQNTVSQQNMQLASQKAFQAAFTKAQTDPQVQSETDPSKRLQLANQKTLQYAADSGQVLPEHLQAYQAQSADLANKFATADKLTLDNQSTRNQNLASLINPIAQAKADPTKQAQLYNQTVQQIAADPDAAQKYGITADKLPPYQGPDQVDRLLAVQLHIKDQTEAALNVAKTGAENSTAALNNIKVNLAKNSKPGDFDPMIDQALAAAPKGAINPGMGAFYKAQVNNALAKGDYEGAQGVVKQLGEVVSGFQKQQYSEGQENFRQSLNRQAAFANTLQKDGLDQLGKIFTDPTHGYTQFLSQAQATKNTIQDAKNGNELASSLAPLMTALGVTSFAGVHRINSTEVNSAGPQVGSLYRRVNAILDKAGTGTLPSDTTTEMNGLIDGLIQAKHSSTLQSANMIANNTGLDPGKTVVLDRQGNPAPLQKVLAQSQQQNQPKTPSGHPDGATMKVPGSDGKLHWSNGKDDLGVVQ